MWNGTHKLFVKVLHGFHNKKNILLAFATIHASGCFYLLGKRSYFLIFFLFKWIGISYELISTRGVQIKRQNWTKSKLNFNQIGSPMVWFEGYKQF